MAEGTGPVALLGTYLQLTGHHAANARRGASIPNSGQTLEGRYETLCERLQGNDSMLVSPQNDSNCFFSNRF